MFLDNFTNSEVCFLSNSENFSKSNHLIQSLSSEIINSMEEKSNITYSFKINILHMLKEVYDFKNMVFFDVDRHLTYKNPVSLGIDDHAIHSLIKSKHFESGPFQLKTLPKQLYNNTIFNLDNILKFKNVYSTYTFKLIKSYNLAPPICIVIWGRSTPIAMLMIFENLDDSIEVLKDHNALKEISKIISYKYSIIQKVDELMKEHQNYSTHFNQSNDGQIIYSEDDDTNVIYNPASIEYLIKLNDLKKDELNELLGNENNINLKNFSRNLVSEFNKTNLSKDTLTLNLNPFFITIKELVHNKSHVYFITINNRQNFDSRSQIAYFVFKEMNIKL